MTNLTNSAKIAEIRKIAENTTNILEKSCQSDEILKKSLLLAKILQISAYFELPKNPAISHSTSSKSAIFATFTLTKTYRKTKVQQ